MGRIGAGAGRPSRLVMGRIGAGAGRPSLLGRYARRWRAALRSLRDRTLAARDRPAPDPHGGREPEPSLLGTARPLTRRAGANRVPRGAALTRLPAPGSLRCAPGPQDESPRIPSGPRR